MDPLISQLSNQCPGTLSGVPAQLFLTLLQTLINAQCDLKPPPIKNYAEEIVDMDMFDFIIVGAGSAGSVVANRLSEKYNVLLLEAGEEPSALTNIPVTFMTLQDSEEVWKYKTEQQDQACQGFKNKYCEWYTGKTLGGSSSVNAMLLVRGHKFDYDRWEEIGNPGWGWNSALHYFKKFEDNIDFPDNEIYHGNKGNQKVGKHILDIPLRKTIIDAAKELGVPYTADIHNGTEIYFGEAQSTIHKGERYSTYRGYLLPIKDRKNLKIITGAYVLKVYINPKTNIAQAVEVKIKDEIKRFRASKEIILSAGALKTPQILMLSGIGPKEHLEEFNIPVKQDLNVGNNLQDHVMFMGFFTKVPKDLIPSPNFIDGIYEYFMHRTGILTNTGLISLLGVINTLNNSTVPDVQFMHIQIAQNDEFAMSTLEKSFRLSNEVKDSLSKANKESPLLGSFMMLLRPKFRGHVRLQSENPFDVPKYTTNYFKDSEDEETLLRAVKFYKSMLQTEVFQKYKPELVKINLPNCKEYEYFSDDYWKCSIRSLSSTVYHYSGTAKMGPVSDTTSVVDSRLKVHGVHKLRVVDASIMPYIVSANTNAATLMIGEKGADIILEDWQNQKDEL